jgi:hypothetical protein
LNFAARVNCDSLDKRLVAEWSNTPDLDMLAGLQPCDDVTGFKDRIPRFQPRIRETRQVFIPPPVLYGGLKVRLGNISPFGKTRQDDRGLAQLKKLQNGSQGMIYWLI